MELDKLTKRISELSRKSKEVDLTEEELKEQAILRKEYIDRHINNLRAQLEEIGPKK